MRQILNRYKGTFGFDQPANGISVEGLNFGVMWTQE
jgi:hypothetical protein